MIILREKNFSKGGDPLVKNDSDKMVDFGKVGLGVSGAIGLASGVEAGKSMYQGYKLKKEYNKVKNLKNNPVVRKKTKDFIKEYTKNIPIPGVSDKIIDNLRFAEKNAPKLDTIDKISTYGKWWNRSSNIDRTILNNAGDWAENGVNDFISKHSKELGEDGVSSMKKIPDLVRRGGKMGVYLKNAKGLGKAAASLGSVSGLLYLNGRSLQQGTNDVLKT